MILIEYTIPGNVEEAVRTLLSSITNAFSDSIEANTKDNLLASSVVAIEAACT